MTAPTAPLFAEQRRIERELAVLSAGESAVINGTRVTAISLADALALEAARGPVRTSRPQKPTRRMLRRFPASNPRGSWPAEEYANARRREGLDVDVVMSLADDAYLVYVKDGES